MESLKLRNSVSIPQIGLGVFRLPDDETTSEVVKTALEVGYRHVDTAAVYGNERATGIGIKESGIPRDEIFITTKLWNDDIRSNSTRKAFENSLKLLGLDYVDLYLIHWPADGYIEAWKEMEKLYKEGLVRAIGVSNFHKTHMENLLKSAEIRPFLDQIESHPYLNNQELILWLQSERIQASAWSPLGGSKTNSVRDDDTIKEIAHKYGKSSVQVILRWDIQRGLVVLPRSSHKQRLVENLDVFDFSLTEEEMNIINALNRNLRVGSDPDNFNF